MAVECGQGAAKKPVKQKSTTGRPAKTDLKDLHSETQRLIRSKSSLNRFISLEVNY